MNPIQRVIKRHRVRADAAPGRPRAGAASSGHPPRAKGVRLVQADGRVQAIEVTCACGEVMVIEIEYEDAPQEARS
ncbi:MAG: hypothetical protein AB1726_11330 [Planctomycetota bacterium]